MLDSDPRPYWNHCGSVFHTAPSSVRHGVFERSLSSHNRAAESGRKMDESGAGRCPRPAGRPEAGAVCPAVQEQTRILAVRQLWPLLCGCHKSEISPGCWAS
jgi:hypothetical protein